MAGENTINLPGVVAEVQSVFQQYETALLENDVQLLNAFFLDAPFTVRYGIAEHSYGAAEIRAYRKHAVPVDPRRKLSNTVITTIGHAAASVSTEFLIPGSEQVGRQTQCWVCTTGGWKIIAAHVSAIPL
jgi:hypothetical protein